jgi:hypothetical protein
VRTVLAFALVLMLSSLAISAPESSQLGPYVVNFDLNTDLQYNVTKLEPNVAESATLYILQASVDETTGASVIISEYNELLDATLVPLKQISMLTAMLNLYNVTGVDDITIDGKEGYIVSAVPNSYNQMVPADITSYEVVYWLDSEKCECGPVSVGKTSVSIMSTFPEDVTMNLINSLKIVKDKDEAAATSEQVIPPE